jgi:hemolysin activation/secretion protein
LANFCVRCCYFKSVNRFALTAAAALAVASGVAQAQQQLPGSVDPGRIIEEQSLPPIPDEEQPGGLMLPSPIPTIEAPKGAEALSFILRNVTIRGMSAYRQQDVAPLYVDKRNKEISAAFIWELANAITNKYRNDGYFLSRAYVPAQTTENGEIVIAVIEGRITDIRLEGVQKNHRIVREITENLLVQRPLRIRDIESALLRLNDLYGFEFFASLTKPANAKAGEVALILSNKPDDTGDLVLSANNYGSRFVGPYRSGITATKSLAAYHKTTVSAQTVPGSADELLLGSILHNMQLTSSLELDFLLAATRSEPGFTLRQSEIESDSISWGIGANWRPIRQRYENLTFGLRLDALNSNTDIIGTPLTRDRIRVARASMDYNFNDRFSGVNALNLTVSRGLELLGASSEGDSNLSRADATPDFSKIDAYYTRQDVVGQSLVLSSTLTGQWASGSLYSSEEFGYGGATLGRAYDFSEITGDHGIAAAFELNYIASEPVYDHRVTPFLFYDVGKVWNDGVAATKHVSASSAGVGARIYGDDGLTISTTLAFPLTKPIDTPIYGQNGANPTLRFGVTRRF